MIDKNTSRLRRAAQTRRKISQLKAVRLAVHRTNSHIYAQLISGDGAKVITSASTAEKEVRAKVAMAAWALTHHKPMITVGAAGGKRHAHQVQQADLGLTTHDPLLAQMRQQLRKAGLAPPHPAPMGIHAVFSKEPITQPQAVHGEDALHCDPDLNCHGYGSLVTVTATFGHCAAGWALNQLSA